MSSCDTCVVRNRAICAGLDSREIHALNAIGRRRSVTAGEPLIWEDDDSLLVANVIDGVLKLTTSTEDGREQIVGVAYPSDFIGRPFGPTSKASVVALTDAKVCVFSRNDFDRFAREHPELEHKLLERTLAPGELLRIDTGCIVALQPSVDFDIQFVGNIKSAIFGGEGLFFATLRGPGRVWLQSLPLSRMANRIVAAVPGLRGGHRREEGSILGVVGDILDGDNR